MKARAILSIARLPAIALAAIILTLAGCLITGETVHGGGLLFFGSVAIDNDSGIFLVPDYPQRHYRSIRIAPSVYPVEVYRVVIVYRDGGEFSYGVGWRFTDHVRYHDLRLGNDRAVREVRIYQRPFAHERRKGEREERRPAGPVSFRIYGLL